MISLRKFSKLISCLCIFSLLVGCSGNSANDDKSIVLKNPVNIAMNYEVATERNLYETKIFSSVVSPYVEEYSFANDQIFKSYEVVPGESVNRGDTLILAKTTEAERAIEDIDEQIDNLQLSHIVEESHYATDLDIAIDNQNKAGKYGGAENAKLNRDRLEQSQIEKNAMYELELEHLTEKKKLIQKQSSESNIESKLTGTVVNCAFVYGEEEVKKDIPLIAIGDTERKLLKCEYISKTTINKAEDVYAIIHGKRYELINESIDSEEYNILKNSGETVYSSFAIVDPDDEVSFGEYAVIVLLKDSRHNVLCVPTASVKHENNTAYVYLTDGESTTYTEIETGMKDDFYIEVLSGIKKGDKVLTSNAPQKGRNTAELKKGECSVRADVSGALYYPFSQWIVSPIDNGTAYIKELCVAEYEEVKEGQKLLTIEVNLDSVEIARCENKIKRINERILDEINRQKEIEELNKKIDDPERKRSDRNIEKNIISYQKDLLNAETELKKLKKYSGIIDIFAPSDGIIADMNKLKVGDLIYKDTQILQFADTSTSYIVLKDDAGALNFGNTVEIDFANGADREVVEGKVVTVSNTSLSSKMTKDWALVEISDEAKALMTGSQKINGGGWSRSMYKVKVDTRKMENVVLVPKVAVEMQGFVTYVRVLNEDGTVSLKNFMSGGSNNDYYWAIEGLDEGTKVCWD